MKWFNGTKVRPAKARTVKRLIGKKERTLLKRLTLECLNSEEETMSDKVHKVMSRRTVANHTLERNHGATQLCHT